MTDAQEPPAVDVQTPNAAASSIAKGMSGLRDSLAAAAQATQGGHPAAAAEALNEASAFAHQVALVFALIGTMDWAGDTWPGIKP